MRRCTPQKCTAGSRIESCGKGSEAILVMKSADNRLRQHAITVANPMAARRRRDPIERRIGNALRS